MTADSRRQPPTSAPRPGEPGREAYLRDLYALSDRIAALPSPEFEPSDDLGADLMRAAEILLDPDDDDDPSARMGGAPS